MVPFSKIRLLPKSEVTRIASASSIFADKCLNSARSEAAGHVVQNLMQLKDATVPFVTVVQGLVYDVQERVFWSRTESQIRELVVRDRAGNWVRGFAHGEHADNENIANGA